MVTGRTGAILGATTVAPAGAISGVDETRTNADSAAQVYIQYLKGAVALSSYDLNMAVSTVTIARAAFTTSDPAASKFFGYLDQIYSLGGAIPGLAPPLPSPPPPRPISGPSPPRLPSPPLPPPLPPLLPPVPVNVTTSFMGCYKDNAAVRALAFRLIADRANALLFCARLTKLAGYPFMGLQGSNCFGGTDLARAESYGVRAATECATSCPGNSTQTCGLTTSTLVLVSVYSVT
ncbi:hypothetical protein TSOC_004557 [Tetrabaena socialis]|uniref:WSC domain-containing protein n=1 Tax=Tetrabaena socialis TaxID=47790 RepID=A0A2J8A8N5_9CHLO|nr:hypothetical protein TSOC_004557 [Tetrabaena socialis]|eukprot:PNH08870.1 hypothetical protein TSOC_004557 [Tetrabaena socialis]